MVTAQHRAIKRDYKQTEVGAIPEDWKCVNVGDLVNERIIAKPLDGNHGELHPKSSDYVGYGIPFVMANNIQAGRIDFEGCKFITEERAGALQKGFSISGDVLLTHKGTVGNTAVVGRLSTEYIMLTPQVTYYRVQDPRRLNNWFLKHYFDSDAFQSLLLGLAGGGTRAYLGIRGQLKLPVVLPPIGEQTAIAAALSNAVALIDGLENLIGKKRALKQGMMQELFSGKRRLPGFGGEWGYARLKDVVASKAFAIVDGPFGSQMKVSDFIETGIPVIEMEHLKDGYIKQGEYRCISKGKFEEVKRSAVYPGDIVVSKTGSLGYLGVISNSIEKAIITSRLAKVTLDPCKADRLFTFQYLMKLRQDGYWEKVSQGGTMQILGIRMIQDVPMPSIGVEEQQAIANLLSDMDADIAALEARRDKARAMKQGMMQQLLTGKIRLL